MPHLVIDEVVDVGPLGHEPMRNRLRIRLRYPKSENSFRMNPMKACDVHVCECKQCVE